MIFIFLQKYNIEQCNMFAKSITLINVILLENIKSHFDRKKFKSFSKSITLVNVILLANIHIDQCSMFGGISLCFD